MGDLNDVPGWPASAAGSIGDVPGWQEATAPLTESRRRQAQQQAAELHAGGERGYFLRRSIPASSALLGFAERSWYRSALQRVEQGVATPNEHFQVADFEERQRLNHERDSTWGGYLGNVAAHIPAIAGEAFAAGGVLRAAGVGAAAAEAPSLLSRAGLAARAGQIGRSLISPAAYGRTAAQTALMPSMYLENWAERGGRPQDLPPAFAIGMLNTAILGRVGAGQGSLAQRIFRGVPVGMAEQQAVDAIGSAVSEFLPDSMKLQTGYGLIGQVVNGHGDEALRHGLGQALTFGVFAGIHGGDHTAAPAAAAEVVRQQARSGASQAAAGRFLLRAQAPLVDALRANPDLTRGEAIAVVDRMPPGFSRDFARRVAESLPDISHANPMGPNPGIEPENAPQAPPASARQEATAPPKPEIAAPERSQAGEPPSSGEPPLSAVLPPPKPPQTFAERLRAQLAHEAAMKEIREQGVKDEAAKLTPDQREEMEGELADLKRDIVQKQADPREVEQWQERARHIEAVLAAAPKPEVQPRATQVQPSEEAPVQPKVQPSATERTEPTSAREMHARIDADEQAGKITKQEASILRQRMDGLSFDQVAKPSGVSRQRIEQVQISGLKKMGLPSDIIETMVKNEKARHTEIMRRRFKRGAKGEVHEQTTTRPDKIGIGEGGPLDDLASQIVEAHENGDVGRVAELSARANQGVPSGAGPGGAPEANQPPAARPPAPAENAPRVGPEGRGAVGENRGPAAARQPAPEVEEPFLKPQAEQRGLFHGVGAMPSPKVSLIDAASDAVAAARQRLANAKTANERRAAARELTTAKKQLTLRQRAEMEEGVKADYEAEAGLHGISANDLHATVADLRAQDNQLVSEHNSILAEVRKRFPTLKALSFGREFTPPKGFDTFVTGLFREHPEIFEHASSGNVEVDEPASARNTHRLMDMLLEGNREPAPIEKLYRDALDQLVASQPAPGEHANEGPASAYQPEEVAPGVFFRHRQPGNIGGLAQRGRIVGQEGAMPGEPGQPAFLHRPEQPPPEETAALANAETRRRRYDQGLDELQRTFRPSDAQRFEDAKRRIEADPQRAVHLVDELERSPRPASIEEDAELLAHLINLTNRYSKAREAKTAAWEALDKAQGGDGSSVKVRREAYNRAVDKAEALRQEFNRVDRVLVQVGRENSDGLRFRQRLATLDYSLLGIVRRAESAANRLLSDKEIAELQGMATKMAAETQARQLAEQQLAQALKQLQAAQPQQVFQSPAYQQHEAATFAERTSQAAIDRRIGSYRWEGMSPESRAFSWLRKLYLNWIISSPTTAVKIAKSGVDQLVLRPVHEMIGSGLKMIPGLASTAAKAPIEGRGFDPATEQRALAAARGALGEAKQIILTGNSRLDILYGGGTGEPVTWLDVIGNLHAAEKQPAVAAEFERARSALLESAVQRAQGRIDRLTPSDLDGIAHQAYAHSLSAKFQQENAVVQGMDRLINGWKASESPAVRAIGHALDLALPVRRIPTNIVFDAFEHVLGAPWAASKLALMGREGRINLTEAQAETIMRQLKRGTLGLPLAILGVALGASGLAGGFYSGGRRTEDEPEAGSLFGMPGWLMAHHPALIAIQVGASAARQSTAQTRGEEHGPLVGTTMAFAGLLDEVPYIREQTEIGRLFDEGGLARMAGSRVSPQALQWIARNTDREPGEPLIGGRPQQRRPQGFVENAEVGVPGLRQLVTEGPPRVVRDFHLELSRLGQARQAAVRRGERFPDERRYRILEAAHQTVTTLEHQAAGQVQTPLGLVQRAAPDEQRLREIRQRQADVARRAIERSRQ